jgi:CHAD domain-containing protein
MKLEPDRIEKPFRKLHKQLSAFSAHPRPEDVHSLRTHTRRLEATVTALVLDRDKASRRLLKVIKPVRKTAGKVRDMDVLIGDALTLAPGQSGENLVPLVEHLARMRVRNARKLHAIVLRQRKEARRRLKESTRLLRKALQDDSSAAHDAAAPRILITELGHWPPLDTGNLHMFRLRVKELRYMLQLSDETDERLVDALGQVKDVIGEWHDWVELLRIANKVLDPESDSRILKQIEKIGKDKFQVALTAANQLRERYFPGSGDPRGQKKVLQMVAGL